MNHYIKKLLLVIPFICGAQFSVAMEAEYKIAILAWGSLVEYPGDLPLVEQNKFKAHGRTGPGLRIEYARKSGLNCRAVGPKSYLTLVISPGLNAKELKTFYATYRGNNLNKAIEALRIRENSNNPEIIGYVNLINGTYRRRDYNSQTGAVSTKKGNFDDQYYRNNAMLKRIVIWARDNGYNAVIWTDLQPSFKRGELTLESSKAFLNSLPDDALLKSYCYFKITPAGIRDNTQFGNQLMQHAAQRLSNRGRNVNNMSTQDCVRILSAGR